MPPPIPIATYRLQLTADFNFYEAASVIPYLKDLGISHVYASPFMKARAGSTHGYDVVDFEAGEPLPDPARNAVRLTIRYEGPVSEFSELWAEFMNSPGTSMVRNVRSDLSNTFTCGSIPRSSTSHPTISAEP
jgi:hypothetical protein